MKKKANSLLVPACCLALAAMPAMAEWKGAGELGLVISRGNSDTDTLNTALELEYIRDAWSNKTELSFLRSEDDGDLTSSRFVGRNNTKYRIDSLSFITGSGRYDRDEFSSFSYQSSLAVSYGAQVLESDKFELSFEAGPGVRFFEERESNESDQEVIGRAASDFLWQISETAKLTNRFLTEAGADNVFLENAINLKVAINGALSLQTGLSVRHNTEVEDDSENTDFLTTINLVYDFG